MKPIWDRIHVWLAANAPEVFASLRPGASEEAIRAAERAMGVTLPDDVRECYRIHDGQDRRDRSPHWAPYFLYGMEWFSLGAMLADWRVMERLVVDGTFARWSSTPDGPVRREWWHPAWIPLTTDHTSSNYCLDLAPAPGGRVGQVILWQNDDGGRPIEADSFREWLADFADQLDDGLWTTHPDYDGLVGADEV